MSDLSPMEKLRKRICMYCDHKLGDGSGHYVPPCFGDPGFPACESICDECRENNNE